jgi:hypothetical protein
MDLLSIVNTVSPSFESIKTEINELKRSYPSKNREELAELYGNRLKRKYTSVGVVSALPSAIPGIGTAVQVAVELGTVTGDLALMLRWMAANCYGIALIYDKDLSSEFSEEFIRILGLWCGAIQVVKKGTAVVATKVTVVHFNKVVTGKVIQQINKKVGVTIFTKYGTKRGGIALGRLIPFGIGALIGGTFNYFTMNSFKNSAIKYFQTEDLSFYMKE